jgi:branched-chain amino acid transport system substrate-binding protein
VRTRLSTAVATFAFALALVAATGGYARSAAPSIEIDGWCDLSGITSDVGTPYCDGEKAYVDYVNSKKLLKGGAQIKLTLQDYAYSVAKAQTFFAQDAAGHPAEIWGWGTDDTEQLIDKTASAKIPYFSSSLAEALTNPERAPYNFLYTTDYSAQLESFLKWASKQAGGKHVEVAYAYLPNGFGKAPIASTTAYLDSKKLSIGFKTYAMAPVTGPFDALILQAKAQKADYIVIQNIPRFAAVLVKDAQRLGYSGKVACLIYCSNEIMVKTLGDQAKGLLAVNPITPVSITVPGDKAPQAWLKAHGSSLAKQGVTFLNGWVEAQVGVAGIQAVLKAGKPVTGENVKNALETMPGVLTGSISNPVKYSGSSHDGNVATRIYEVQSNGSFKKLTGFVHP